MSVKDLVEKKKKERIIESKKCEIEREKRIAATIRNERKRSINTLLGEFKYNAFSLESSESKVADFIVNWPNGVSICKKRLDHLEDEKDITRSKIFCEWRDALQNKFGIKIRIIPRWEDESQPGDEGPDYTWKGYMAYVEC